MPEEQGQSRALRSGAVVRRRSWWRRDAAVTHLTWGHGVITNFIGCDANEANVYFYHGDCVRQCFRWDMRRAGPDWHANNEAPPNSPR